MGNEGGGQHKQARLRRIGPLPSFTVGHAILLSGVAHPQKGLPGEEDEEEEITPRERGEPNFATLAK